MTTPAVVTGLAVGDASGAPFERLSPRDPALRGWDGEYRPTPRLELPAGAGTDDSAMAMALGRALLIGDGYNPGHAAAEYLGWLDTPDFKRFGAGRTTTDALGRLRNGGTWQTSGSTDPTSLGNGPAMRVAPMGLRYANQISRAIEHAKDDAIITHNVTEARAGAAAVAACVVELLAGFDPFMAATLACDAATIGGGTCTEAAIHAAIEMAGHKNDPATAQVTLGDGSTIMSAVARAFYCLLATRSFGDAVVMAVRGGGDADTVGAITGALAGARYGLEGIPRRCLDGLVGRDEYVEMDRRLAEASAADIERRMSRPREQP